MPEVSVIIPTWNCAQSLPECLRTVFSQTLADIEVIIVDDGSTDDTARLLHEYRDRARIIRTERRGAAAARNRGAREARGEYLFFCDADLVLDPAILELMANVARRRSEMSFVFCGFLWDGRVFGMQPFDPRELKKNNFISTMSLIRRAHFPGFDESLKRFQDWDLWLTMLEEGRVGTGIARILFASRASAISGQGGWSRLLGVRAIRAKHRLPFFASDYWFAVKESLRRLWTSRSSS